MSAHCKFPPPFLGPHHALPGPSPTVSDDLPRKRQYFIDTRMKSAATRIFYTHSRRTHARRYRSSQIYEVITAAQTSHTLSLSGEQCESQKSGRGGQGERRANIFLTHAVLVLALRPVNEDVIVSPPPSPPGLWKGGEALTLSLLPPQHHTLIDLSQRTPSILHVVYAKHTYTHGGLMRMDGRPHKSTGEG